MLRWRVWCGPQAVPAYKLVRRQLHGTAWRGCLHIPTADQAPFVYCPGTCAGTHLLIELLVWLGAIHQIQGHICAVDVVQRQPQLCCQHGQRVAVNARDDAAPCVCYGRAPSFILWVCGEWSGTHITLSTEVITSCEEAFQLILCCVWGCRRVYAGHAHYAQL